VLLPERWLYEEEAHAHKYSALPSASNSFFFSPVISSTWRRKKCRERYEEKKAVRQLKSVAIVSFSRKKFEKIKCASTLSKSQKRMKSPPR
jgi:hypothetical protein